MREGLAFDFTQQYAAYESLQFKAEGYIKTADGATVLFRVELQMTRMYTSEVNQSLREGDAQLTDPLVINFNGSAASLSPTPFTFDRNADGSAESMAFPEGDSGLLALDRNATATSPMTRSCSARRTTMPSPSCWGWTTTRTAGSTKPPPPSIRCACG